MSSPFQVFRKYSGPMMVAMCVMALFAFVLADPLTSYLKNSAQRGGNDGGRDPGDTAVSWRDGSLSNQELGNLVYQRRVVKGFLENLYRLGGEEALAAGADPRMPPRVELVAGVGRPEGNIEREVLQTKLFADEAHRLGMEVGDENIRHYLSEVGRGRVSSDQMRRLLSHSQFGGGKIPIGYIFTALREELLARNLIASYQYAFSSVMPQQRWEDWLRVNDRVVVEAAALPVQQFVVDVPEPQEAELVAFFEEFKAREALPQIVNNTELPSPTPGFASPQRIRVQLVKADYNSEITRITDEVTDEEIAKYYEDNKEMFIRADSGLDDFSFDEEGAESDDTAASEETGEASDEDAVTAEETPAEEAETSETAEEAIEEEEEEEEEPADTESDTESDAGETTESDGTETDEPAPEGTPKETPKETEYQPLEEVRDDIRLAIAERKVADRLAEKMKELYGQLKSTHTSWEAKVFDAEDDGKEPPAPPAELTDLKTLAETHGLEFQKMGNLSRVELRDTPFGASGNPDRFGRAPLWLALFSELEMFEPVLSYDLDGNRYLSMKMENTPENVPELDDVRSEVVLAWKLREAAKLAEERAKQLAKEAKENGLPLADIYADNNRIQVAKTEPFSWLTIGNISPTTRQVSFRMSEPEGVVAAGPDFMKAVFALDNGETDAVLNHNRTIAYVVRMAEHSLGLNALHQQFLVEADRWYGLPSMSRFHNRQAARSMVSNFIESSGVDWKRPADMPPEEDE